MTADRIDGTEFTARIGRVAGRALVGAGYSTYDELAGLTVGEVGALHGVGPKAVRVLEEELTARGLVFRGS